MLYEGEKATVKKKSYLDRSGQRSYDPDWPETRYEQGGMSKGGMRTDSRGCSS